jgi:tetratricopeptide (TPR) repeat protein
MFRVPRLPTAVLTAFALLAGVATVRPALAQAEPATVSDASAREQADAKIVQAAMAAAAKGGPIALQPHLKALGEVLKRAPASYPLLEARGDTVIMRGSPSSPEMVLGSLVAGGPAAGRRTVVISYNTYPQAALLLASFAIEAHQPAAAVEIADRGLAMQPENAALVSERAQGLYQLKRFDEGERSVSAWLAAHPQGAPSDRARLLRSQGFGLTELGRLDEAEAAYVAALKIEPGHALALNELDYIRGLKTGKPKAPTGTTTADKAGKEVPKLPALPPTPGGPT